jgi:phosphotransferase system HPr-like phosphotransfer protein
VLGLLLLKVTAGCEIVIKTDGQDEDEAADALVQLIAQRSDK